MFIHPKVPLSTSGYKILETLHKDTLETIYLANALEGSCMDKPLILKQISPKSLNIQIDPNSILLRGVQHNNLLTTFECFYEQGDYWLVMPYFQSISLDTLLKLYFPSGISDRIFMRYILSTVLSVLNRVHSCSSQIRALKPSKILINQEGEVNVLDCEIGSVIREGLVRNYNVNPYWNAPEVLAGAAGDSRSDIWTFGVLLYTLITGKNPWENYPYMKASIMITHKPAVKIGREVQCEGFLKDLTTYCLQKDPERRPTAQILMGNPYFSEFSGKKHVSGVMHKVISYSDSNVRKLETMLQPKPLCGEDPDEMLDPEFEPE